MAHDADRGRGARGVHQLSGHDDPHDFRVRRLGAGVFGTLPRAGCTSSYTGVGDHAVLVATLARALPLRAARMGLADARAAGGAGDAAIMDPSARLPPKRMRYCPAARAFRAILGRMRNRPGNHLYYGDNLDVLREHDRRRERRPRSISTRRSIRTPTTTSCSSRPDGARLRRADRGVRGYLALERQRRRRLRRGHAQRQHARRSTC